MNPLNKKYSVASVIGVVIIVAAVLTFVIIKAGPAFHGNSISNPISEPTANEPAIDSATGWTTYRSSACGISYAIPPGWVSQGWAADGEIVNLSSPDDIRQEETNPRMTDAGPSPAPISFYVNCTNDVASVFVGQDEALVKNGATVEEALAKGLLRNLKNARYLETLEVAGQKAFLYEIGNAGSGTDEQYDSIFLYVKNRWVEIRPSMTRYSNITQDQREILDSIRILNTK